LRPSLDRPCHFVASNGLRTRKFERLDAHSRRWTTGSAQFIRTTVPGWHGAQTLACLPPMLRGLAS